MMVALALGAQVRAQEFSYRGFGEVRSILYPLTTPQDDERVSLEGRIRFDPVFKPISWLALSGSLEGRLDNLELVERTWRLIGAIDVCGGHHSVCVRPAPPFAKDT